MGLYFSTTTALLYTSLSEHSKCFSDKPQSPIHTSTFSMPRHFQPNAHTLAPGWTHQEQLRFQDPAQGLTCRLEEPAINLPISTRPAWHGKSSTSQNAAGLGWRQTELSFPGILPLIKLFSSINVPVMIAIDEKVTVTPSVSSSWGQH